MDCPPVAQTVPCSVLSTSASSAWIERELSSAIGSTPVHRAARPRGMEP